MRMNEGHKGNKIETTSVTYVPGLSVTYVLGCTGEPEIDH
jgi:hypothetical protein